MEGGYSLTVAVTCVYRPKGFVFLSFTTLLLNGSVAIFVFLADFFLKGMTMFFGKYDSRTPSFLIKRVVKIRRK